MFCALRQQILLSLCAHSAYPSVACQTMCHLIRGRNYSSYGGMESSKQMQKLLSKKGAKNKRKWYQPHIAEPQELTGRRQQPNKYGVSEAQGHRARQLSHVLYVKICEIVNSGELDEELLSKQVLITQVKMHPNFSGINVFWDANRTDAAEIESLLDNLSGKLRSLLISYHVLGRIPAVTFVKDRSKGDLALLNQLFEVADYGPDYFPSSRDADKPQINLGNDISVQSLKLTTEENLSQNLADLNRNRFEQVPYQDLPKREICSESEENVKSLSVDTECQPLEKPQIEIGPECLSELSSSFRSNLYGLPRDDLLKKILAKKKKVRYQAAKENQTDAVFSPDTELKDYRKLRTLAIKDKEKLLRQKDSTKTKQKLLEAEFDEVQGSLYELNVDWTDDEHTYDNREDL